MGLIQLNESGKVVRLKASASNKAGRALDRLHKVPSGKNLTYWSAGVLAFLIAPIAAMSLSAKPGAQVNLESAGPDVSNTESADVTAPGAQDSLDASITSGAVHNSSSADVHSSVSSTVEVNGHEIEVPENGNVNQTVVNEDGSSMHVNINSSSTTVSGDSQKTKNTLRVRTNTDSNIRIRQ